MCCCCCFRYSIVDSLSFFSLSFDVNFSILLLILRVSVRYVAIYLCTIAVHFMLYRHNHYKPFSLLWIAKTTFFISFQSFFLALWECVSFRFSLYFVVFLFILLCDIIYEIIIFCAHTGISHAIRNKIGDQNPPNSKQVNFAKLHVKIERENSE